MTYEERIVKLCKECPEREQCGYVPRKLMGDCTYLQDVMSGWELGYQDAVEKAAEWIECFCNEHYIMSYSDSHEVEINELIDIFKKKMEE